MENPTMHDDSNPSPSDGGDHLHGAASMLTDARQRGEELYSTGRQWVVEHPLPAVAGAFVVGYVLAGGLVSKTTLRLAKMGMRFYLKNFLSDFVGRGAQELFGGMEFAQGDDGQGH